MSLGELVEHLPARDRQEAWNWLSWTDGYLDEFLQERPRLSEDQHLRDELTFVLFLWWLKRKYGDSFRGYEGSLRFLSSKGLEAFAFGQSGTPYSMETSLTSQWARTAREIRQLTAGLGLAEVLGEPLANFRILDRYLGARARGSSVG